MAFTYDVTTDRGKARFQVADTVEDRALFSDAEIDAALTMGGSVTGAVVLLRDIMLTRAARTARSYSNEQGSVDDTAGLQYLQALAEQARADAAGDTLPAVEVVDMGRAPNDPYYAIGSG